MGEGELETVAPAVARLVERRVIADLVDQQICQAVLALIGSCRCSEAQAAVQVGVVAEPMLDELFVRSRIRRRSPDRA